MPECTKLSGIAISSLTLPIDSSEAAMPYGRKLLGGLFAIAVVIRLSALALLPSQPLGDNARDIFVPAALRIVAGMGYNDLSTREYVMAVPGYSYFLAAFFGTLGPECFGIVRAAQAAIDAATAVLTFLLAARLAGRTAGCVAFAGYSLYPLAIHYSLSINPECLFTFMQVLSVFMMIEAMRRQSFRWCICAGVLFSLTTLIRSSSVILPLLFVPFLVIVGRCRLGVLAKGTVIVVLSLCGPLLWGLRNQEVLGEFTPLQTGSGSTFFNGSDKRWMLTIERYQSRNEFLESLRSLGITKPDSGRESDINQWFWRAGVERYKMRWRESPADCGAFICWKFFRNWYATEAGNSEFILGTIHFPLVALLLAGIAYRRESLNTDDAVLIGTSLAHIAMGTVFHPMVRYIVPAVPFMMAYVAIGVLAISGILRLWAKELLNSRG